MKTIKSLQQVDDLDVATFEENFLRPGRPVLVTQEALKWPAVKTWSFETLNSRVGQKLVQVQKYQSAESRLADWQLENMTLSEYINKATGEKAALYYLANQDVSTVFPELTNDIALPKFVDSTRLNSGYAIFVSGNGQRTEIHYHPFGQQAIFALVWGRKRVHLYPSSESKILRPFPWKDRANWSTVLEESPERFPGLDSATCIDVVVTPGQVLYIPPHWWHSVESLEPTISLTLFFKARLRDSFSMSLLLKRDLPCTAWNLLSQRFR